jgi:large subunit ribosomal protein L25
VLVKEYQVHPVEARMLHADFYRVAMDKLLRVTVPVHLTGEAKASRPTAAWWTSCTAKWCSSASRETFPEHLTIDISDLGPARCASASAISRWASGSA